MNHQTLWFFFVPNEVTMGQAELANQMGAYYRRSSWAERVQRISLSNSRCGQVHLCARCACAPGCVDMWIKYNQRIRQVGHFSFKLHETIWNSMKLCELFSHKDPFQLCLFHSEYFDMVGFYVLQSDSRWHQAMSPGAPQQAVPPCCRSMVSPLCCPD